MYANKTKNIGKIKQKERKNFWQLDDENFLCRFLEGDRQIERGENFGIFFSHYFAYASFTNK